MQVTLTFFTEKYRFGCDFQNRRFTHTRAHFSWFSISLRFSGSWGQPRNQQFHLHVNSILQNWNDIYFF